MDKNYHDKLHKNIFKNYAETIWVYLKGTNIKGVDYDPFRKTGFKKVNQNPEPVKAHVRQIQGNSLIARELGLVESGAIEVVIKSQDENLFRICEKIIYNDVDYTPFKKGLGDRIQIFKSPFGFSRVVLFQRGA
jgi:hypothetical protein